MYILMSGSISWTDAKAYAESMGGYLATITSEEENAEIKQLLGDFNLDNCWLGAECTSGEWKWVTDEEFLYTNWTLGEPNCSEGIEFYLGIYNDAKWNDYSVANPNIQGFIIELVYDNFLEIPEIEDVVPIPNVTPNIGGTVFA